MCWLFNIQQVLLLVILPADRISVLTLQYSANAAPSHLTCWQDKCADSSMLSRCWSSSCFSVRNLNQRFHTLYTVYTEDNWCSVSRFRLLILQCSIKTITNPKWIKLLSNFTCYNNYRYFTSESQIVMFTIHLTKVDYVWLEQKLGSTFKD
jgi:hypothetical protein